MIDDKDESALETIDASAKPIAERIPSVDAAETIFSRYREANTKIARSDAKVISIHRGTEPYDPDELLALGQGWRANLNMRELKGSINNRADLSYDLHMDTETRINVSIRPEYKEVDSPRPWLDFGKIIAEEYTYTLNHDWDENYLFIDQVSRDRIKLGLGVATWSDHLDWRPSAIQKLNFISDPLFPPVPNKIPICMIRDTICLQDLLKYLSNREAAAAAGWNADIIKETILLHWDKIESSTSAEPASVRDSVLGTWAAFEQWKASRPSDVAVFELEKLPVIRFLVKAADSDKVSHYIHVDTNVVGYRPSDFLFKKLDQYDSMSQALWLNPYNYSEGTIGSLDGLGHDLAPYAEISNRMLCSALDGGMMSSGLLLQAGTGFDADEASVIRMGPSTLIPPGLQAVQTAFRPDLGSLLSLRQAVRGVFSNNVGMTRMSPENAENTQISKSKEQVQSERSREFRLETNSANFEYLQYTQLHKEIFRRMVKASKMNKSVPGAKEANMFRERCINRGVPEKLLDEHDKALVVEVSRTVGDGSPQSRTYIWSQMMQLRGSMDEAGRRHTEREYASSLIGYRNVDSLFPLRNRDMIPTNELSIATLENNDFLEGRYIPAGSDQIHTIHLNQAHFKLLTDMAKAYNEAPEQADVQMILKTFAAALPHCQEHLQALATDPSREQFVKEATSMLTELVMFYRQVEQDAAKIMQEQQKLAAQREEQAMNQLQQRMDAETTAKLRKVELDAQLEAMRQQSIASVREAKTQAQNEIRAQASEMKAQLDRDIAERKLALEEEIAQRKLALEDAKAARQ